MPGPGGSLILVHEVSEAARRADWALLEEAEEALDDLDAALRRLDAGTYWHCEVCEEPLGEALLAESPLTRRCAEHSPAS
jgi:RNA polymerase-binding transcription factor DksA